MSIFLVAHMYYISDLLVWLQKEYTPCAGETKLFIDSALSFPAISFSNLKYQNVLA